MSTILNALRRLENDQPARPELDTGELDRQILAGEKGTEKSEGARSWKRVALISTSVVLSGIAGVGVTLAGLSYWQSSLFDPGGNAVAVDVSPVAADEIAARSEATRSVPVDSVPSQREEETTVVVVADILRQRGAGTAIPVRSLASASPSRERAARVQKAETTALISELSMAAPKPPIDATKRDTTNAERTQAAGSLASFDRTQDPISQLAAARRARMTRVPESPAPKIVSDEPTLPRPDAVQVASVRVEPEPREPIQVPVARVEPAEVSAPATLEVLREPMPLVAVMSTVWHPRPERRRAQLSVEESGETRTVMLREGEFLGPLQVSEIGPIGVTLKLKGVEIEHRVGGKHR